MTGADWIPCDTSLPEPGDMVIVTFEEAGERTVICAWLDEDNDSDGQPVWMLDRYDGDRVYAPARVVAWTPMPPPYAL